GRLKTSPAELLSAPGAASRLPTVLTVAEAAALMAVPAGDPLGRRDGAIIELLYGSGLRVSELCSLDVDDVDLAHSRVRVFGKGAKERVVPVGDYAAAALRVYLDETRSSMAPMRDSPDRAALFFNRRRRRI